MGGRKNYEPEEGYKSRESEKYFEASDSPLSNVSSSIGAGITIFTCASCFEQIVENNPKLTKYIGVDMASTTPKPRLYYLMHIKSDMLDLSFVEKVLLPQDDILNIYNGIVPGSARLVENRKHQLLSFDLLNRFSVHLVGFYGNNMAMVVIFGRCDIVNDVTMDLMREGKLKPSLYGALHEETFHIFYWHEGENLVEASRKDISCNFIWYLVELCPIVHMCLDASGLEALLMSSKPTFTTKVCTQRLKLVIEKSSENDLEVHPGFEIHLADCEKVLTSVDNGFPNEVSSRFQGFNLVEGYHAAAILVAKNLPPKKSTKEEEVNWKRDQMPLRVRSWKSEYSLHASGLTDDQFALFLEASEAEVYKDLCDLIETSSNERKVQANKAYEHDSLVSEAEQNVLGIFEKALSAYLKLNFPWKESLLLDSSTLKNVQSSTPTEVRSYSSTRELELVMVIVVFHHSNVFKDGYVLCHHHH